ncbi:MAG: excinuclease ABC subunit UvrC [Bacteroidota bacterium]
MDVKYYKTGEISTLPTNPGVYKFYSGDMELIYVGKAKNIKKRVSSYFSKSHTINRKTRRLVHEIVNIECTITNSEFDSLLLENNLIKQNQPKYNILLKDDKTFPYICILKERFPRIISTRKYKPEQGEYFGPYSSVVAMNNVLDLIRKLYTIRTCKLDLSEKNITAGKFKVCLEYHIGNCQGPCVNLQSEEDYKKDILSARDILKGSLNIVKSHFKDSMNAAAEALEFERAQYFKDKIDLLDKFQAKSLIVNPKLSDIDVFTITSDERKAFINFLQVKNGAIMLTKTVEVKKKLEEADGDILSFIALELRNQYASSNSEILSNVEIPLIPEGVTNTIPKIGDKRKLVSLSFKNALEYKRDKTSSNQGRLKKNEAIIELKKDLELQTLPVHIECFDNSNLQGSNPVASMVCFKNGVPSKKDYRHFNIKTVVGPDDFASMYEIVTRRYKRLTEENQTLPNLIVIDGGKGQLSSACSALKDLGIYGSIPIIGIAKRLEEIYFPEDTIPVHISKKSQSLKLLQRLRDEAHRFAITFHRKQRSKSTFKTELDTIPGIGPTTIAKLLKAFKSIKKIKDAELVELESVIGQDKAKTIYNTLNRD